MKTITRESPGIEITFMAEEEDVEVRGNFDSGDAAADKALEDEIIARLDSGDIFAWFCARVRVTYRGILTADTYLGACSYANEEDFKQDGGYFKQMVDECIAEINVNRAKLCEDYGGCP
jgi:hypothetical protein